MGCWEYFYWILRKIWGYSPGFQRLEKIIGRVKKSEFVNNVRIWGKMGHFNTYFQISCIINEYGIILALWGMYLFIRNAGAIKYILETSNQLKTVSGVPVAFERDLVSDYVLFNFIRLQFLC